MSIDALDFPSPLALIGHMPDADLGPVISPQAKQRISKLVQSGIDEGATCILDGRNVVVPGFEKGNFVGPTILTDVKVIKRFTCFSIPMS